MRSLLFSVVFLGTLKKSFSIKDILVQRFHNWLENFDIKYNDQHHLLHVFDNWLNNDKVIDSVNKKNLSL